MRQGQGTPGSGFVAWDVDDLEVGLGLVYAKNWSTISNPFAGFGSDDTVETLAARIVKDPTRAADVYRKVKDRGIAQQIFRAGLFKAYDRRCSMCDLSFCDALEAAHIIPFADCSIDQRINITNGLLLCANHHRLFDSKRIKVLPNFRIFFHDPKMTKGPYTSADKAASIKLHGKRIRRPSDSNLWPKFENPPE